jgi:hypothetical protein
MTTPIALPTIHLNGTGATGLRDEYRAVRIAAAATADALAHATCNARDFYPQELGAFQQAQADRREMFRLLEVVQAYAEAWEARAAAHIRG